MNSAIDFSPSPSMSSAPRDTKCRSRSKRCAGQIRPPVQRTSTSPSSATASLPHIGTVVGEFVSGSRGSSRVRFSTTCGITSPARWMRTRSPMRRPEPRDLVAVVERDVGDDDAADADRLQPPDRRQLAGAADLDVDRLERGFGLLGGELVGEPPARRAGDEAEPLLPGRAGRPCRRRRRCRTAGPPAPSRSRDNARAFRRGRCSGRAARRPGSPKPSIRFIASILRSRPAAR